VHVAPLPLLLQSQAGSMRRAVMLVPEVVSWARTWQQQKQQQQPQQQQQQ
jgi:hypothetical protein